MPKFEHDCEDCKYLGSTGGPDFYICPESQSLVRRFSDEPSDYGSIPTTMVVGLGDNSPYWLPYLLAKEEGYIS